jgi:hypothetical protein
MPWRETSAMDERLPFVQDVHRLLCTPIREAVWASISDLP